MKKYKIHLVEQSWYPKQKRRHQGLRKILPWAA
jgi:hypothetical protein